MPMCIFQLELIFIKPFVCRKEKTFEAKCTDGPCVSIIRQYAYASGLCTLASTHQVWMAKNSKSDMQLVLRMSKKT